jgi:hypothetical protein
MMSKRHVTVYNEKIPHFGIINTKWEGSKTLEPSLLA